MTYQELVTGIKDATKKVDDFWKSIPEGKENEVSREKREEIKTLNHQIEEWQQEASEIKEVVDLRTANDATKNWLNQSSGNMRHSGAVGGDVLSNDAANAEFRGAGDHKGIIDQILGDPAFKSWHKQTHPAGMKTPEGSHVESPHISLKDVSLKTLVTSAETNVGRYTNTSGGVFVQPQVLDMVSLPFRPLKLREVVTVINATSPLIEYPKITGYTNNAAEVAEATDTTGSTGVKPESALALALGVSVASTVAHWMPISRQALSDAPQLDGLLREFLGNGLEQRVEDAMITGSGSSPVLQGITTLAGTSAQAFVTNILTTTRKAITKAQKTPIFVEPNAFLMSPDDWEAVDLSVDNEFRYYYGGPSQQGTPRLWGKPVIVSQAVATGTAWTGDLKTLVLADLQEAQTYITDSHSTWFTVNLLAMLMELRLHFFALRPAAIIKVATA
jgi:HK97 family phage major capsid protein